MHRLKVLAPAICYSGLSPDERSYRTRQRTRIGAHLQQRLRPDRGCALDGNNSYAMSPDDGYCAQRYRSYDPASGTYVGYDGRRHSCQ
jgi:hypothetical protein